MTRPSALRALLGDRSGAAMIEFALGAPLLLFAGLGGVEMANFALVNMRISQLALHLADNGSRIGDTSTLQNRKIYESDINDLLYGAQIQGGKSVQLYDNARVIISSVERTGNSNYIHWQRCRGAKNVGSSYGNEGDDLGADGIGPTGNKVSAMPDDAVIFVEVNYTYQPLVWGKIITNREIKAIASYNVRDSRDLSQIYQRDPGKPDPVQTCTGTKKGNIVISGNGAFT